MYAIVEIAGQQFKVAKDQKVFVHRLPEEEGAKVSFDNVLLIGVNKKLEQSVIKELPEYNSNDEGIFTIAILNNQLRTDSLLEKIGFPMRNH